MLNITKDAKYYYSKRKDKNDKYELYKEKIKQIAKDKDYTYGKRRITQELRNKYNIYISEYLVAKLMKECNIYVKTSKKRSKYSYYQGQIGKLVPNLLNRDFSTERPYQKIVTDISEFEVNNKKIYISPFIDLYGNRVIAYTLSTSPTVQSVMTGLNSVLEQIPEGTKTIIHSDQGHQYQHEMYRNAIANREGVEQSMSRKGNCLDNGACESFFGRLKEEKFYGISFSSIEELAETCDKFIYYYNWERIQIELGGLTPMQYVGKWMIEHNQKSNHMPTSA